MGERARVDRARLHERNVNVGQGIQRQAVVGAQRTLHAVQPPIIGPVGGLAWLQVGPQPIVAGAVTRPAFQPSPDRGALILLVVVAPFVVAAGHAVEHESRNFFDGTPRALQEVFNDLRQREARAGARIILIRSRPRIVRPQLHWRSNGDGRPIEPVAKIDGVRLDRPPDRRLATLGRHDRKLRSSHDRRRSAPGRPSVRRSVRLPSRRAGQPRVGRCHLLVVLILRVGRTVVERGECLPVTLAQGFQKRVARDELGKGIELFIGAGAVSRHK